MSGTPATFDDNLHGSSHMDTDNDGEFIVVYRDTPPGIFGAVLVLIVYKEMERADGWRFRR